MNKVPRDTLVKLISEYGTNLSKDSKRLEGLLRDYCGQYRREIHLLVSAGREVSIFSQQESIPFELKMNRVIQKLKEEYGTDDRLARWAAESWAQALGFDIPSARVPTSSRSPLHIILIIGCSDSMNQAGKIQALNNAIREMIPHLQQAAKVNPNANMFLRVIQFSTGARWHMEAPVLVDDVKWEDLKAGGRADMSQALKMVAEELHRLPGTAIPPCLVLCSDCPPTDDVMDGLKNLLNEPWGRKAIRLAVAIGPDADSELLQAFIFNPEIKPLQANNAGKLVEYIKFIEETINVKDLTLSKWDEIPDPGSYFNKKKAIEKPFIHQRENVNNLCLCLNIINDFEIIPSEPLWHNDYVEKIQEYIKNPIKKPLLITGFIHFGGTYLADIAIKKVEVDLKKNKRVDNIGFRRIEVDFTGEGLQNLELKIEDLIKSIKYDKKYKGFQNRFEDILKELKHYPNYILSSITEKNLNENPGIALNLNILNQVKADIHSRKVNDETTNANSPNNTNPLYGAFKALCTEQENSFWNKNIIKTRNSFYRIILLIDKLYKLDEIRSLNFLWQTEGALRPILIINRNDYEQWLKKDSEYLNRFHVLEIPLLKNNVADALCRHYFHVDEETRKTRIYNNFVDGLNFCCRGMPGEVKNRLSKLDKGKGNCIEINIDSSILSYYSSYAPIDHFLKIIDMNQYLKQEVPHDNPAFGETDLRLRTAICATILDIKKNNCFSETRLISYLKKEIKVFFPFRSTYYIHTLKIAKDLIDYLTTSGYIYKSMQGEVYCWGT